jgi:DUF1009 family protein
MMGRVGLVAGSGSLPVEFVKSAREKGDTVVVFALQGMASSQLEREADKVYWMNIGQYKKFVFLLLKERIKRLALVGKVSKNLIYKEEVYDEEAKALLKNLRNKKDYSILEEVTRHLSRIGIEVIDGMRYLSHLLPDKGVLTRTMPDARIEGDIKIGHDVAKKIAGMDIGQTVIVKDKAVVAVEAMEGTDAAIARAREIAGGGCVMVKVSRPNQDLRWDVPTVGPETMTRLSENGFSALAIESGKMFLVNKEETVRVADANGIVVEVI